MRQAGAEYAAPAFFGRMPAVFARHVLRKKEKNMRTPKSVRMFFVKERRFGESIYEETGAAVACLREFPLTSFPVTIGYFF